MDDLMKRFACTVLFFAGVAGIFGCSDGGPKAATKGKVSGKVLLDGKPMPDGEVRFNATAQPIITLQVTDGAFAGEVYTGRNLVEVIREKEGPPHPMDPTMKLKVNTINSQYSGAGTILNAEVPEAGKSDLKFEVNSARK